MKTTKSRIIFFAIAIMYNLLLGLYLRDFLVLSQTLTAFYLLSVLPTLFLLIEARSRAMRAMVYIVLVLDILMNLVYFVCCRRLLPVMTMFLLVTELMYYITFSVRSHKDSLLTKFYVLAVSALIVVTLLFSYNFVYKPEAPYPKEKEMHFGVLGIEFVLIPWRDQTATLMSRYISKILRHHPELAGISLDAHGWADVDDLLQGINQKYALSIDQLKLIVVTDDKQRFCFNKSKTKIRANHAHSISVDVGLEEASPPEILWHGTSTKNVESIEQAGLISGSRLYVHLSTDYETAISVGGRHGSPIVYAINSAQIYKGEQISAKWKFATFIFPNLIFRGHKLSHCCYRKWYHRLSHCHIILWGHPLSHRIP